MKLKVGKKSGLKYFDVKDIRSWESCYDPSKYLKEDWRGTALDILKNEEIPHQDRLWVVLRNELVSDKVMRLFAVWCYRQTLIFLPNQDPRCIEAANVAERFANGEATNEELAAAEFAARSATAAAMSDTYSAARAAAYTAARSAAWSAWSARSAEVAALTTQSAPYAAWSAANDAAAHATQAWPTSGPAQRDKLIEMIIAEGQERRK